MHGHTELKCFRALQVQPFAASDNKHILADELFYLVSPMEEMREKAFFTVTDLVRHRLPDTLLISLMKS